LALQFLHLDLDRLAFLAADPMWTPSYRTGIADIQPDIAPGVSKVFVQ
jgi:hypothetical protein